MNDTRDEAATAPERRAAEGARARLRPFGRHARPSGSRRANQTAPRDSAGRTVAGDSVVAAQPGAAEPLPFGFRDALAPEGAAATAKTSPTAGAQLTAIRFTGAGEPGEVAFADAPALIARDENFVWVDVSGYTDGDIREVGQALGMPRQAVRAALAPWQRPRLVIYPEGFFVSVTVPLLDPGAYVVHAGELDLFIGRNLCVSMHKAPLPFAEHLRTRAVGSPELIQLDAAYMLYLTLDELLAYYEELNRHVRGEIERMEERALRDASDRFLEDLLRFKRYTFALSQLADQHRDVFAAFLRPDFTWVSGAEVEDYFEDLERRLTRLLDLLLSAREAINGAFEIYVSTMSHRTNQVIKVLTLVSTVLLPASIILGLFGTNLANSERNVALNTPLGLALMLLCMLLVSGGALVAFHRRGWL